MVAFEQQSEGVPKPNPANEKLSFTAVMQEKSPAAPAQADASKARTKTDAAETTKQTAELSALLSPYPTDFRTKDNRTYDQIAQSQKEAINKPISHDEFVKAQNILKQPGLSDDATRSAIAEKLNLPATAKDADIRQKIADSENMRNLVKEIKLEPLPEFPKHTLNSELFKAAERVPNTKIESNQLLDDKHKNRIENDAKGEILGHALVPGLGQTKDNRRWDDRKKADQEPFTETQLKKARAVLNKPDLSDGDTTKAIAETLGLPAKSGPGEIREKLRFDESMRQLLKENYELRPELRVRPEHFERR